MICFKKSFLWVTRLKIEQHISIDSTKVLYFISSVKGKLVAGIGNTGIILSSPRFLHGVNNDATFIFWMIELDACNILPKNRLLWICWFLKNLFYNFQNFRSNYNLLNLKLFIVEGIGNFGRNNRDLKNISKKW